MKTDGQATVGESVCTAEGRGQPRADRQINSEDGFFMTQVRLFNFLRFVPLALPIIRQDKFINERSDHVKLKLRITGKVDCIWISTGVLKMENVHLKFIQEFTFFTVT